MMRGESEQGHICIPITFYTIKDSKDYVLYAFPVKFTKLFRLVLFTFRV